VASGRGQGRACWIYLFHIVVRSNLCRIVVLRGCEKLPGAISYFLASRSPLNEC